MPNASTEVGGEIRRGTREENEREGEDIKICFVFSFRRSHSNGTRLPGPPRLSGWSQIAFGTVLERSVASRAFLFFTLCRRAVPSQRLPLRISLHVCMCFHICIDSKTQREKEREEGGRIKFHVLLIPEMINPLKA